MLTVLGTYRRRMAEREEYMREHGRELPHDHFPRLTVVFDEANESRSMIEQRHKGGRTLAAVCRGQREWRTQGRHLALAHLPVGADQEPRRVDGHAAQLQRVRARPRNDR